MVDRNIGSYRIVSEHRVEQKTLAGFEYRQNYTSGYLRNGFHFSKVYRSVNYIGSLAKFT